MLYENRGLLIDNQWLQASSGGRITVKSAATEEPVGSIPAAGHQDLLAAVASAEKAFADWQNSPAWTRAAILREAAELIRSRADQIAEIIAAETGKPLAEGKGETAAAADQFDWHSEEAKRIYGQIMPARSSDQHLSVIYQPVGVCLSLTAWNFPVLLPARKIAAALAAGCTIIARPATEAPGAALELGQALIDAGTPPGVVNILTGYSIPLVADLIAQPAIKKVSLTGSVNVGRQVLAQCADGIKRTTMELGGHAPVIVNEDSDPVAAARMLAAAKFRNCGQVCISPSRFYVHASIAQPFAAAFTEFAQSLTLGNGQETGVDFGPMIRGGAVETALELIGDATAKGGRLLTGGRRPPHLNRGHFLEPTVLENVSDDARIMNEEPFAPIAPIASFRHEGEVLERANSLAFGLAAYVFGKDTDRTQMMAEKLHAGMVGINETMLASSEIPFGGIGESGMGREGGSLGIFDYLEAKYIRRKIPNAEWT